MVYKTVIFDLRVPEIPIPERAAAWFKEAMNRRGIEILKSVLHEFPSPVPGTNAYSWSFILSASHAVIHTAPEDSWVEIMVSFCNGSGRPGESDPKALRQDIIDFWKPVKLSFSSILGKVPE